MCPNLNDSQFIAVRSSQVHYYQNTPLYHNPGGKEFLLYKGQGDKLSPQRMLSSLYPPLFLHNRDRVTALQEAQEIYTNKFLDGVKKKDQVYVKTIFAELVSDLFHEARIGAMKGMFTTALESIELLLHDYAGEIIHLANPVSKLDYGTALHSVNVMAISLSFCHHLQLNETTAREIALCGLLHDIGKAKISNKILYADRRLSNSEFETIMLHPKDSQRILAKGGLPITVQKGALEHHEKLNGKGYPSKTQNISLSGKIIGLIDCYEALTCDDRIYRRKLESYDALSLIKKEMVNGSFDKTIYKEFICCLKSNT